jgi:F-type H+-transporting ATPase subunit gamma
MANLKESVINYFRFIYDANYIGNENGFCSKAKESTRCDHNNAYAEKLTELLQNLLPLKVMQEVYHNDIKKVLLVVVTSNRGLAGAFNTNAIKLKTVLSFMQENK